jgi:leucyl-tRNA synthetase
VWVGNYVLMAYGEGAVMGVPGHDQRDFEFARHYRLPIKPVIRPQDGQLKLPLEAAYLEYGECFNSGKYDGLDYQQAVDAVAADLKAKGLGEKQVLWRLRDWGISRQRYWGTPIPIIHCPACGDVPVPDRDLPVVLPEDCVPDGTGNPLAKRADFVDCKCPQCGKPAQRETDTMDTFVDSSWYYLRFACPDSARSMVDARVAYWLPVDQYIGGIEHAILHLLYSRFWTKVMRDLGLAKLDEPFAHLLTQGMVLNHVFVRTDEKGKRTYFAPEELDILTDDAGRVSGARAKSDGQSVPYEGISTMSKSSRNGVDPQELVDHYGADIARFFMMFTSPPEDTLQWSDAGVEGAARYLRRLWNFAYETQSFYQTGITAKSVDWSDVTEDFRKVRKEIHANLKQANYDIARHQFNTVASAGMKILNALERAPTAAKISVSAKIQPVYQALITDGLSILLRLISPIAPHISHYLWRELKFGEDVLTAPWPEHDPVALIEDEIELVVQVNGTKRGNVRVPREADKKTIEQIVLALPFVRKVIEGLSIKKIIIVPGRLVNVVV